MQITIHNHEINGKIIEVDYSNFDDARSTEIPLEHFEMYLRAENKIGEIEIDHPLSHPDDPSNRNGDTYLQEIDIRDYLEYSEDIEIDIKNYLELTMANQIQINDKAGSNTIYGSLIFKPQPYFVGCIKSNQGGGWSAEKKVMSRVRLDATFQKATRNNKLHFDFSERGNLLTVSKT